MTWCIDTCNFDVDVDLLFQENLTIGQKIALTEKIVAVLPEMKCPHAIEPHQIQGLDFIHIFPVIQVIVYLWDLSSLGEVGLNPNGNQVMYRPETEDWSGPKSTSLEQGLASWLGGRAKSSSAPIASVREGHHQEKWLVKKSVETRQEMGDFTRSFAINQFDKHFSIPEERLADAQQENVLKNIKIIKEVYRPQRRFRRKDAPPDDEESRVQSTLLEYGYNFSTVIVSEGEDIVISVDSSRIKCCKDDTLYDCGMHVFQQQIQRLMRGLASTADQEGRLTAGVVGNIVNLQAAEIAKAAERYAVLQSDTEGRGGGGSSHSRALATLQRQKVALEEKEMKLLREKDHLETSVRQEAQRWNTIKIAREKVEAELADLEKLETEENQGILRKLQGLVVMNESLKQQEQEFREQCKLELSRLQNLVKAPDSVEKRGTSSKQANKGERRSYNCKISYANEQLGGGTTLRRD
uniref:Coiled-coil domain-containing protein 93 n=1 Tax=Timema monikensis TaxID=170555 RepID=A0A7R9EF04_9NEOP|nr:unnamed protein product [Timema monikensis]